MARRLSSCSSLLRVWVLCGLFLCLSLLFSLHIPLAAAYKPSECNYVVYDGFPLSVDRCNRVRRKGLTSSYKFKTKLLTLPGGKRTCNVSIQTFTDGKCRSGREESSLVGDPSLSEWSCGWHDDDFAVDCTDADLTFRYYDEADDNCEDELFDEKVHAAAKVCVDLNATRQLMLRCTGNDKVEARFYGDGNCSTEGGELEKQRVDVADYFGCQSMFVGDDLGGTDETFYVDLKGSCSTGNRLGGPLVAAAAALLAALLVAMVVT